MKTYEKIAEAIYNKYGFKDYYQEEANTQFSRFNIELLISDLQKLEPETKDKINNMLLSALVEEVLIPRYESLAIL